MSINTPGGRNRTDKELKWTSWLLSTLKASSISIPQHNYQTMTISWKFQTRSHLCKFRHAFAHTCAPKVLHVFNLTLTAEPNWITECCSTVKKHYFSMSSYGKDFWICSRLPCACVLYMFLCKVFFSNSGKAEQNAKLSQIQWAVNLCDEKMTEPRGSNWWVWQSQFEIYLRAHAE